MVSFKFFPRRPLLPGQWIFLTKLTTTRPPIIALCLHLPYLYVAARLYSVAMGQIPRSTERISSSDIQPGAAVAYSGGFRLGPGEGRRHRPPVLLQASQFHGHPWFFCKDNTNICFLRFQILENRANLQLPSNVQKPKTLEFQGASPFWPPDQGLCPWTLLGVLSPDLRYRLALPRSPWDRAPSQILRARIATGGVARNLN